MNSVVASRLVAHGLLGDPATDPIAVVRRLAAVQAQEFASALWAIGVRLGEPVRDEIARAVDEGRLIRTHVLRPTWHIVAPGDLRWMLALTRDRVHQCNRPGYRELELDAPTLRRCRRILVRALTRSPLTRADISAELMTRGIEADGRRLAYLLMHEELEGIICNGPRRGKQLTYSLVDQRVASSAPLGADEAAATLLHRYLSGHGPATLHDFVWWSGLTVSDARRAESALGTAILRLEPASVETTGRSIPVSASRSSRSREAGERIARQRARRGTYLALASGSTPPRTRAPRAWLLPNFDEWFVGYRDRTRVAGNIPPMAALSSSVIVDGIRVGAWTRTSSSGSITITPERSLSAAEQRAIERARAAAMAFLGNSRPSTDA